jgi:tetratricopeptide (TPR) repeat protein
MKFVSKIFEAPAVLVEPLKESKVAPSPATASPAESKYTASAEVQAMYKRGEDESKRKNWANAIEAFGNATQAGPKYPDAWRELVRAHMNVRQYSEAEAAIRKYLQLAPDDHLAYLNMAWVLFNEKKFEEERELMLKRIAVAPDDGDALFRLGTAYLALKHPEQAVPVLERAIVQFPKYVAAHLALGQAYLENHQDLLAQIPLRKAVTLDDSESNLNNAAYLLAAHDAFLDLAENWSERSIEIVEKELNNSAISNVQSSTWALVSRLSHYWDTLGWTMFRQGKTDAAQK